MGVDIYFISGKKEFSFRLYHLTNLIDDYGRQYKKELPELVMGKHLKEKEIRQLFDFLNFSLLRLKEVKTRTLSKFDSLYFKKSSEIYHLLGQLTVLLKIRKPIDKKLFPKLYGLVRRLEGFNEIYRQNPEAQKNEIADEFDEKISLVKKIIQILITVIREKGSVSIY